MAATDNTVSRNSTKVFIEVDNLRVGRVQSIRQDITNNVQVLAELGRAFNVELKKGITTYTFTIAKFYTKADVFESLKLGKVFSLAIQDQNPGVDATDPTIAGGSAPGAALVLEKFTHCAITSLSRDYTVGAATVGENATVVTIGQGHNVTG